MIYVILGISGCGKSTQAALLAKDLGVVHISTGRLLRWELEKGTPLGVAAYQKWWGQGLWPPNETVFKLLEPELKANLEKGFVLEGWPRVVEQAKLLDDYLTKSQTRLTRVLLLETDEATALSRLRLRADGDRRDGRLRPDETSEVVIAARFLSYKKTVTPIISYYEKRRVLSRIDNNRPVEAVYKAIKEVVAAAAGGQL